MSNVETIQSKSESADSRKVPIIDPAMCVVNHDGAAFKEIFVRLPEGAIADDLKEFTLWKRVQGDPGKALRKMDRVIIVNFDESMMWTAFVSQASPSAVVLSAPQRHELRSRIQSYFADEKYRIEWGGRWFRVVRIKDNVPMSDGHATESIARRALENLYPKPAA